MFQNLVVGCIAESYRVKVVLLHKLIKEVGAEHNGLGDCHLSILVAVKFRMTLDDIVKKCQTTSFTAERALADTCEVTISIKLHAIEYSHHTDVLHTTILHDGIEDNLSVSIDILEFMPGNVLQESRDREDGTGTEPTAHVVARHMVEHRVTGNLEDIILQFLERTDARHLLLGCRVTENKVTKTHVLLDKLMQIDV